MSKDNKNSPELIVRQRHEIQSSFMDMVANLQKVPSIKEKYPENFPNHDLRGMPVIRGVYKGDEAVY